MLRVLPVRIADQRRKPTPLVPHRPAQSLASPTPPRRSTARPFFSRYGSKINPATPETNCRDVSGCEACLSPAARPRSRRPDAHGRKAVKRATHVFGGCWFRQGAHRNTASTVGVSGVKPSQMVAMCRPGVGLMRDMAPRPRRSPATSRTPRACWLRTIHSTAFIGFPNDDLSVLLIDDRIASDIRVGDGHALELLSCSLCPIECYRRPGQNRTCAHIVDGPISAP